MSITLNTRVFEKDREQPDSNTFAGPDHTFSNKDIFTLSRVYPVAGGGTLGVARPSAKFTRTVAVGTDVYKDAILGTTGSLPVGMTDQAVEDLADDMSAWLASADGKTFLKSLRIDF